MITIDKLDKVGSAGVAKELGDKFGAEVADRASSWLSTLAGAEVPEQLKSLWQGLGAKSARLRFDPTLVRGMGYYTGTIFEIEHPGSSSSIGGGGRYDGMVGKWLGTEVPAVGISLGIERIVDLVELEESGIEAVVLVIDAGSESTALEIQQQLIAQGMRVRIELRPKNLKVLLEQLAENGFNSFAIVGQGVTQASGLEFKPLG
jgi:histidyl-tRNA synthetase